MKAKGKVVVINLLGGIIAACLDMIVVVPSVALGFIVTSRRSAVIGYVLAYAVVLAIKMPMIGSVARELGKQPRFGSFAASYAISIAIIALVVWLIRAALRPAR